MPQFARKPILLLNRAVSPLAEPRLNFIMQMIRYAAVPRAVTKKGIDSPFGLTIIFVGAPEVFLKVAQELAFGVRRR